MIEIEKSLRLPSIKLNMTNIHLTVVLNYALIQDLVFKKTYVFKNGC